MGVCVGCVGLRADCSLYVRDRGESRKGAGMGGNGLLHYIEERGNI